MRGSLHRVGKEDNFYCLIGDKFFPDPILPHLNLIVCVYIIEYFLIL